jgi:hypothetical protein
MFLYFVEKVKQKLGKEGDKKEEKLLEKIKRPDCSRLYSGT